MKYIEFTVNPQIPKALKPLEDIAHNLWLSWNDDALTLFTRLDFDAWIQSNQNPVRMLGMVSQDRYEKMAKDDSYLAALKRVNEKFRTYVAGKDTWYHGPRKNTIAYFSMEYGRRPAVPARIFPSVPERRRLSAGVLSGKRLVQHAGSPCARQERKRR